MHVGMTTFFQNLIEGMSDRQVYQHELSMADRAEPLGFDSIWSAEHHFDNYTMTPNVAQFLTYMAGRTERVNLGSMVMVLPWHNPVRLAEEICVLDHVSNGRAIIGVGRGLGRIEFEGFQVEMGESRERFIEYAGAIFEALETGFIKSDGKFFKQPPIEIHPQPFQSFKGRLYASAVSPESSRIMARLGIGILIIAQKPWELTLREIAEYRKIFVEENDGAEAPKPLLVSFIAVHENEDSANEMYVKYLRGYSRSALNHYEFHNEGLADIKGYEYYGGLARNIAKHGTDEFVDFLARLQTWGTPDQVFETLMGHTAKADLAGIICAFSYGGMPHDMAINNMELFAQKVLPRLHAHDVGVSVGGGQSLSVTAE